MKKQTAVEFLVEQLEVEIILTDKNVENVIKQAKEIEKQQIIEAWIAEDNPLQRLRAEQYYNETFNKKKHERNT